jgi:hypothetical protein
MGSTGWVREGEISRFVGEALFEYIDGAAEMYHKYDFVELSAAEYRMEDDAITADIYRFTDSDRAFGMYTTLRPETPDTITLGVEGFAFGANLVFVKGPHIANVYGYDDSEDMISAVRLVASTIEVSLRGTSEKPQMYDLFPEEGRVPFTEKIYAESYLGQGFLTDVYTIGYSHPNGRFTLFVSDDPNSEKYEQWERSVDVHYDPDAGYKHLAFKGGRHFLTTDPYHGEILVGAQDGRLVGIVGSPKEFGDVLIRWINSQLISAEE